MLAKWFLLISFYYISVYLYHSFLFCMTQDGWKYRNWIWSVNQYTDSTIVMSNIFRNISGTLKTRNSAQFNSLITVSQKWINIKFINSSFIHVLIEFWWKNIIHYLQESHRRQYALQKKLNLFSCCSSLLSSYIKLCL